MERIEISYAFTKTYEFMETKHDFKKSRMPDMILTNEFLLDITMND